MYSDTKVNVGVRGSYNIGSDRYPVTITKVSRTKVTVRVERVTKWEDSTGVEFEQDPEGRTVDFTLRQDGSFRRLGAKGGRLSLWGWSAYQDPCF